MHSLTYWTPHLSIDDIRVKDQISVLGCRGAIEAVHDVWIPFLSSRLISTLTELRVEAYWRLVIIVMSGVDPFGGLDSGTDMKLISRNHAT